MSSFSRGLLAVASLLLVVVHPLSVRAQVPIPRYEYNLANFSGNVPYDNAAVHVDRQRNEVYVGERDTVRIYNVSGMEEYEFFVDPSLGAVFDVAVDEAGDVLVLSFAPRSDESPGGPVISRYDFRGRLTGTVQISQISTEFEGFSPNVMILWGGKMFLANRQQMRVIRTDMEGRFERGWNLGTVAEEADPPEGDTRARRRSADNELGGFALDRQGRFLFTVPLRFRAFRMNPETGATEAFGRGGSQPGRFSIIRGIAADDLGFVYVADRGRGVVLAFSPELRFFREFSDGGPGVGRLRRPGEIEFGNGRLYVTQMGRRGIAVFSLGLE